MVLNSKISSQWHGSIKEISKEDWNQLETKSISPFFQWNWLHALEKSESVSSKCGWQPIHLSLWKNNKIIAFAPLYLKNHSFGEFIFDQAFAQLSRQLGVNYYPKLVGMSPFSPIEGYRFLIANDEDTNNLNDYMFKIIDNFAINNNILSSNFLYIDPQWKSSGEANNYTTWINSQALWTNKGEKNFDEFLQNFNSNQRRNIKRERRVISSHSLNISILNGDSINNVAMELMHSFYENHCAKWGEWGSKYLTKNFFIQLANEEFNKNVILFNANRGDAYDPVSMSMCITNWDTMWGRYWGSKEEINDLHFEMCYYLPISWAIQKKIKHFDPGAGGSHKLRRGFTASPRYSLHKWYDLNMDNIIKLWMVKANKMMRDSINTVNNEAPFKR